ncbi:uncharacterized protein AB675_7129 [Cyphellophora attinorum]|uniref:Uncharacterized protein n=1 Tax=Cyphellophora attinorum TaxID=1664694 RepID=A0A0N1HE93_9EURO|nr:uncharacterized protein AB675_7129 [Phialophora attinorum]KPI43224.1 hypothetical protein AB675_7129 [Phialophora attinorum]
MSNKFNEPWTHNEKIQLLLNILQGQHPDVVGYLVHHIQERGLPQWQDIALPAGRSLHASQVMFQSLVDQQHRAPQSFSFAPSSASPFSHTSYQQSRNFTEPVPHIQAPIPRVLKPRPARSDDSPAPGSTNGETPLTIVQTAPSELSLDRPKKRGRPTKEEAEERDRLLAAEGKVYEPKKRPSKKTRTSTGAPVPAEEATTASASSDVTQTPLQRIDFREDSSSGKRRSRRQESQLASKPALPVGVATPQQTNYDNPLPSPSDRFMARPGERSGASDAAPTPAVTANPPSASFTSFRLDKPPPAASEAASLLSKDKQHAP